MLRSPKKYSEKEVETAMYETWEQLKADCMQCRKCSLCETRTNLVFGVGSENAEVMFIGEGPGENEDLQGEPFVGRGGKLLDKFLEAVDLDRKKNIYIANIVKCRPPRNRDPLETEQDACIDYLRNQVALIRPKIIVCLGRIAACRLIRENLKRAGFESAGKVVRGDYMEYLRRCREQYDIILLDPPYAEVFLENALKCITEIDILRSGGIIVAERPQGKELPWEFDGYTRSRDYKYGQILLTLYRKA